MRFVIATLFLSTASVASDPSLREFRMTPSEIRANQISNNQIGSSGLKGVHTKVLFGNPEKAGFYTILLFVPEHTTIQAHSHRDDRIANCSVGRMAFWLRRSL